MKRLIPVMTLFGLLVFSVGLVCSAGNQLRSFYYNYLDSKIAECVQTSAKVRSESQLINHSGEPGSWSYVYPTRTDVSRANLERYAEIRRLQGQFYREHMDELVSEMLSRNLGTEPGAIDRFLTVSFFNRVDQQRQY